MQAVTFQAPGEVRVEERPEPELLAADDAIVRVEATGVCGSDLHIYHGRVQIEPGFTIGHEFVGTVSAAGPEVTGVAEGDRVLGCYCTACGECFFCRRGDFHKCDEGRVFGHGKTLGSLQGAQAEQVLVPHANLTLRRVPEGMTERRRAVRRRRDGHRLARGRRWPSSSPAPPPRCWASARWACAPCRPPWPPGAERVLAIDTRRGPPARWPSRSAPRPCT